jgi:hypothetical protein
MNYYSKYSDLSPRVKKLLAGRSLRENRKSKGNSEDDFTSIIRLFAEPVYGGQDAIVKAQSRYEAARRDRVYVSAILGRGLDHYASFTDTPRWPDRQKSDWLFSSLFCAALNNELDVLPDRLDSLMKDLAQVIGYV